MLPGHQSQPELGARRSPVSTINMALRRICRWSARKPSRFRGTFFLPSHVSTLTSRNPGNPSRRVLPFCGASPHWHTSVSLSYFPGPPLGERCREVFCQSAVELQRFLVESRQHLPQGVSVPGWESLLPMRAASVLYVVSFRPSLHPK